MTRVERPRAARYPFVTRIELTDLESDRKTMEKTTDLSLFGCHVVPGNSLPTGTRIRLQITHRGKIFEALGRVTNVRPIAGIGIVFTKVEERDQLILEQWVAELRDKKLQANN